jgi:hypothetical protein
MEHIYTAHTKLIEGKAYYFVKKIMTVPELGEVANLVTGYGMHTDFEKACNIAGIDDPAARKKLLAELEQLNYPKEPVKKPAVEITGQVNKWLSEIGVAILN